MDKVVKHAAKVSYKCLTLNATICNHSQLIAEQDSKIIGGLLCSGACLRRRWTGDGRGTPASPPPPQLLEVAPLVDLPIPAARTPTRSRPWYTYVCMTRR